MAKLSPDDQCTGFPALRKMKKPGSGLNKYIFFFNFHDFFFLPKHFQNGWKSLWVPMENIHFICQMQSSCRLWSSTLSGWLVLTYDKSIERGATSLKGWNTVAQGIPINIKMNGRCLTILSCLSIMRARSLYIYLLHTLAN